MHLILLTLACVAVLAGRIGGAHLHLCFDGSEPPASLHFNESGHPDDHHLDSAHDDLDISAIGEAIAKAGKVSLDLPALLFFAFLLCLLAPSQGRLLLHRSPPRVATPAFLRPPLRGPPGLNGF